MIEIASDALTARSTRFGAELSHPARRRGRELMTDADPAFWTGRAPLLFPIVGRLVATATGSTARNIRCRSTASRGGRCSS
jgi:hypothetical protein